MWGSELEWAWGYSSGWVSRSASEWVLASKSAAVWAWQSEWELASGSYELWLRAQFRRRWPRRSTPGVPQATTCNATTKALLSAATCHLRSVRDHVRFGLRHVGHSRTRTQPSPEVRGTDRFSAHAARSIDGSAATRKRHLGMDGPAVSRVIFVTPDPAFADSVPS